MRIGRRADKARVYRRTRRTLTSRVREGAAAYREQPLKRLLTTGALLLGLTGAVAFSLNASPLMPMLIGAGVLAVLDAIIRFPAVSATLLVLLGQVPFLAPTAAIYGYGYGAGAGQVDVAATTLTLLAAMALTALLAHRTTLGRPWVTTLLVALAVTFIGPLIIQYVASGIGFLAAYLLAGTILFLRSSGPAAVARRWRRLRARLSDRRVIAAADREVTAAEEMTAAHLADLGASYTVLHDVLLPGGARADHLVIGPSGVFLVASQSYPGVVRHSRLKGLTYQGEPLAPMLQDLLKVRHAVADELGLAASDVQPLTVIHDASLPQSRSRVALFTENEKRVGDVIVLGPGVLNDEIATGVEVLAKRRVSRLVRRARRRLMPALAGTTETADDVTLPVVAEAGADQPVAVAAALVDADGRRDEPGEPVAPEAMFKSTDVDVETSIGQRASVLTTEGVIDGFRVCGVPQVQGDGVVTVALCTEVEWRRTSGSGMDPETSQVPLASVQPV